MCAHITHSGAQSLLLTVGGWRRMQGVGGRGGGGRGVRGRAARGPAGCGGSGQVQRTGGPIHAIR